MSIKGDPNKSFALSSGITLCQFIGCAVVPLISVLFQYLQKRNSSTFDHNKLYAHPSISTSSSNNFLGFKPPANLHQLFSYMGLSVLVFCATGLATLSVTMVSYPTKIVFKSAKLVPTMIMSTVMHGKTYAVKDYAAALMLCLGAVCFTYSPGSGGGTASVSGNESGSGREWIGISLLTASVVCDAIVPNWQQALMSSAEVTAEDVMVNSNLIGFVILLAFLVYSGHLSTLIDIVSLGGGDISSSAAEATGVISEGAYYQVPLYMKMAAVGATLGIAVNSYTYLIKMSGSVVAVSVATLRKIVTILLSYLVFPKAVSSTHLLGLVAVTLGILIESVKTKK